MSVLSDAISTVAQAIAVVEDSFAKIERRRDGALVLPKTVADELIVYLGKTAHMVDGLSMMIERIDEPKP